MIGRGRKSAAAGRIGRGEAVGEIDHPRLGKVTFAQSLRARRVSISVRGSGEVRLTCPPGVSQRRALAFLEEKLSWIEAARERMARRRAALPPQLPPEI